MKIKKIYTVYFSPTGHTKNVVQIIGNTLKEVLRIETENLDITSMAVREKKHIFKRDDVVVLGIPTYAGRIPNKIVQELKTNLIGNHTPIICVATYGNRSVGSTLKESILIGIENSFFPIGACTIVCQHAFTDTLAFHRPDEQDKEAIRRFAHRIADKMNDFHFVEEKLNLEIEPYYIPLKEDRNPAKFLRAKPKTNLKLCKDCKQCVKVCPMQSIDFLDVSKISGICIKCQACVHICKEHAKYFDDEDFLSHVKMLENNYQEQQENKFWMR